MTGDSAGQTLLPDLPVVDPAGGGYSASGMSRLTHV